MAAYCRWAGAVQVPDMLAMLQGRGPVSFQRKFILARLLELAPEAMEKWLIANPRDGFLEMDLSDIAKSRPELADAARRIIAALRSRDTLAVAPPHDGGLHNPTPPDTHGPDTPRPDPHVDHPPVPPPTTHPAAPPPHPGGIDSVAVALEALTSNQWGRRSEAMKYLKANPPVNADDVAKVHDVLKALAADEKTMDRHSTIELFMDYATAAELVEMANSQTRGRGL